MSVREREKGEGVRAAGEEEREGCKDSRAGLRTLEKRKVAMSLWKL